MGEVTTLEVDPIGPIRAVLGGLTDTLVDCSGPCGFRLLGTAHWGRLEPAKRKRLLTLDVRRNDSAERCSKCIRAGVQPKPNVVKYQKPQGKARLTREVLERLPQTWAEIKESGGTYRELAKVLGVSRERARQLVKEHDLPQTHSLVRRAEIFVEELEHLAGMHMGVAYIAQALGMEPDALVKKVNHLHHTGKTKVVFHGWTRNYSEEREAA